MGAQPPVARDASEPNEAKLHAATTKLRWLFGGCAIVAALLATVQPVLGPFAMFRPSDPVAYESLHLVLGGILYNAVLVLVVLAPFSRLPRRWVLFSVSVAQYGLTHLQLRLGLASNDNLKVLAYHIPIGVLILLLAYLTVVLSFVICTPTRFQTPQRH